MRRLVATLLAAVLALALLAPAALAQSVGQGAYHYAPDNDKVPTIAGFIVIAGFPLLILLLSLLQWRLDKRKERRKGHLPARDWAGGW